ncbi:1-phosphofructokinase [Clostridium sp. E02]|uniref:1-phosphofructokinase n=1 Tax=Clostridium sp. E02 TaxID=2487134 RepID=UPI000F54B98D|nr:1-phosphofructokinase [Clostridium sp. E02]
MIYTITFNPALDYVVKVDHFTLGSVNRTESETIYSGGKGLNVSAILETLGYENTALGFIAGFTGQEIEKRVHEMGFQSDFIHVEKGCSRINVKLKSEKETEINGIGPMINDSHVEQLFAKLTGLCNGDVLVLSGSIPKSVDDDIYERIMEFLDGRGVRIVVDATKDLLLNVLKYHPFLIKPNSHELGDMFGVTLKDPEDIIHYGKLLQQKGAQNVLISRAGDGAILITEEDEVIQSGVPSGVVINSVGAGDSMVAGFIAGYLENGNYKHALRLGSAAGSASAFSEGLADKKDIIKMYEGLKKEGY